MPVAPSADEISIETDVLIVGGGITGAAAAYYLARDGVEVALVERDDLNGQGSGRTAGNIHGQASPVSFRQMDADGRKGYGAVLRVFVEAMGVWKELALDLKRETGRDVEVIHGGGLMVAETDDQMRLLERKVAYERSYGLSDNRLISAAEVRSMAPYITENALGADFCPGEGHANPLLTTPALAAAAERRGARLFRNAEVTAIERTNRGFETVTKRGRVKSRRIVNAAGGWCDSVAQAAGVAMPMKRQPIQMIVTETAPRFVHHLVYHAEHRLTMKQVANGNLVIGGAWPAAFGALGEIPVNLRTSVEGSAWIASRIVPGLRHLRILRAWTGTSNVTADGLPVLDQVGKLPGCYVATFPGYGFTGGPLFGRLIAEMLQGRPPSFDIRPFALARFEAGAKAVPDF